MYKLTRSITDKVLELKDAHKGESCYIIGDGVSLKWFDLHSLPKKKTFALNWAVFHKEIARSGFDFAINTGPYQFIPFIENLDFIRKDLKQGIICKHYRKTIIAHKKSKFFLNLSNYSFISGKNIYFLFSNISDSEFEFGQECKEHGENIYQGSLKCALALAIFMGFGEVFLVGCDYTHEEARMLHWYEKGEGSLTPHPEYQRTYFEIASNYTNITTVTTAGKGSVLPSVTYTKLTGNPMKYRENEDLTDHENLDILSSWPGYSIF